MTHDPYWPEFLDFLDSNQEKALDLFAKFLVLLLQTRRPKVCFSLSVEERKDCLPEIFLHCVKDDYRVLRTYRNMGRPFSHYLYEVVRNIGRDKWRQKSRAHAVRINDCPADGRLRALLERKNFSQHEHLAWKELAEVVSEEFHRLDKRCRLLLNCSADESTIREIVFTLALPRDQNKKVSDDLRYCREKLRRLIEARGYDLESFGLRGASKQG